MGREWFATLSAAEAHKKRNKSVERPKQRCRIRSLDSIVRPVRRAASAPRKQSCMRRPRHRSKGRLFMQSTLHSTRARRAQPSEADQRLERIARPVIAEMAVWPNTPAGSGADRPDGNVRHDGWTPAMWRMIVDFDVDGAAANADDPLDPWPPSAALMQAARTRRAEAIGRLLRDSAHRLRDAVARVVFRYRRRRHARAITAALTGLDDPTLRDLGIHRSEIGSVAAEATGEAEQTRTITRAPA
jgi:uncharacterized protein YjiS (DUF1127 family)